VTKNDENEEVQKYFDRVLLRNPVSMPITNYYKLLQYSEKFGTAPVRDCFFEEKKMENEHVITFNVTATDWAIKITKEGIKFNREKFPDAMPDDFARVFIELLEREFIVKFEKRSVENDS